MSQSSILLIRSAAGVLWREIGKGIDCIMGVNWSEIDRKYPSSLDKSSMSHSEWVKARTLELYSYLPLTSLEDRFKYVDIRDAVIELNYTFFGFIASHTFINNSSVSYEDKFQSALLHFCEQWPKFMFTPKYRSDLSFGVFFKPRVSECIERELNEVKYSLRRTLCMEVGKQLGKHWAAVTYDDLKDVDLPPDKMNSLKAMFGSMYPADLETHAMFIESDNMVDRIEDLYSDHYDSLTDMLIHEMVTKEEMLEDKDLLELSEMLDVPFAKLKALLPEAAAKLKDILHARLELVESFE